VGKNLGWIVEPDFFQKFEAEKPASNMRVRPTKSIQRPPFPIVMDRFWVVGSHMLDINLATLTLIFVAVFCPQTITIITP
jgi:hypothetical protein